MRLDSRYPFVRVLTRSAIGTLAGFTVLSGVLAAHVSADPADDALAKLNQLSRQAEQTTEAMHSAQLDLNNKLAAQRAADKKHDDAQAAVDAAKARLASYQGAVNKLAAATYMGGRVDGMTAMLDRRVAAGADRQAGHAAADGDADVRPDDELPRRR